MCVGVYVFSQKTILKCVKICTQLSYMSNISSDLVNCYYGKKSSK